MRFFGPDVTPLAPVLPDSVYTINLVNAAQAADYPSGTDLVRVTFCSTAGAAVAGVFNGNSTGAAWGSSASATAGSSAANSIVPAGQSIVFQRNRSSTGFSVIASSNALCTVECWSRAGTT
jgi:hypothetical protein